MYINMGINNWFLCSLHAMATPTPPASCVQMWSCDNFVQALRSPSHGNWSTQVRKRPLHHVIHNLVMLHDLDFYQIVIKVYLSMTYNNSNKALPFLSLSIDIHCTSVRRSWVMQAARCLLTGNWLPSIQTICPNPTRTHTSTVHTSNSHSYIIRAKSLVSFCSHQNSCCLWRFIQPNLWKLSHVFIHPVIVCLDKSSQIIDHWAMASLAKSPTGFFFPIFSFLKNIPWHLKKSPLVGSNMLQLPLSLHQHGGGKESPLR